MLKGMKSSIKVDSITAYSFSTIHESLHLSCFMYVFFMPKVYSVVMHLLNVSRAIMLKEKFFPQCFLI